jgi:hypothetical protein
MAGHEEWGKNCLWLVGSLLLIIGCVESPLESQMKIPMKEKYSITAEQHGVLLT